MQQYVLGLAGTINKRMVEPGAVVSPGTPMFEIAHNINSLKLSVLVDESQVGKIQLGQQVAINVKCFTREILSVVELHLLLKSDAT